MAPDDISPVEAKPISAADFMLPKDVYFSAEVAELEKQKLWPKVWQVVGRLEELTGVGSYVTYDILDESVIVIRTSEKKLKAFKNACRHRGRQLLDGRGQTQQITCVFHGWKYNI